MIFTKLLSPGCLGGQLFYVIRHEALKRKLNGVKTMLFMEKVIH